MDKEEEIRIIGERVKTSCEDIGKLKESITGSYCDGSISFMGQTVVKGCGHCSYSMVVRKYNPDTGLMDFISQKEYLEDDQDESYIEFLDRMGDDFIITCPCCGMITVSEVSIENAIQRWNEGEVKHESTVGEITEVQGEHRVRGFPR